MNNLKNYSIGLEPEAHEALIEIKAKSGASIQWQIREAIDAYIKGTSALQGLKQIKAQLIDAGNNETSPIIKAIDELIKGGQSGL